MRTIHLNRRGARTLRENLIGNQAGYDFLDLQRLDHLAKGLTEIQGEYGERMAVLAREEKQIRRQIARGQDVGLNNVGLINIAYEVEDLDAEAEAVDVCFVVEDGDYNLIKNKLDAQENWLANDEIRHVILGMIEAVNNAEKGEIDGSEAKTVKQFRRK